MPENPEEELEIQLPDRENAHSSMPGELPKLILPPAIPVRPPKYTHEEYELEHADWLKKKRNGEPSWRIEQRRRWKEGFAGLTGIHYFYLTQVQIADGFGNPIRPTWRDVDDEIFQEFDYCYRNGIDLYVFKRREVGLSSIFGGVIPLWMTIMHPNSNVAMTSADLSRVGELLDNKLIFQHDYLEDWLKPKRKTYDKNKGASFQEIDDEGKIGKNLSKITCRQTSQDKKDVTNLEGPRLIYAFLDELFQHPFPQDVRGSVLGSMKQGLKKLGIIVAGGSAGSVTRLGQKEINRITNSVVNNTIRLLFLKGTKGISAATIHNERGEIIGEENFCINGWSDEARAETYIKWQRAIYDLDPNKKDLNWFVKQYPLSMEEVRQSDEVGVIPKDVADRIPEQDRELQNNPRNLRTVVISKAENGKFTFQNASRGAWLILEQPLPGETYYMGTDAIPMMAKKGEATLDPDATDRSMHCTVIKRKSTNSYVAIYLRRTSDVDLIFEEVFNAQEAYNHCQNMIERNSASLIYDRYSQAGKLNYLAFQPTAFGGKGYKKGTVRGVYKDGNNTERIYNAGFDYFRESMQEVDFPIILEQLRVFGQENTDVIDAIMMCEVFVRNLELTDGKRAQMAMQQKYKMVPHTVYEGGRRVVRYQKMAVDANGKPMEMHPGMKPLTSLL